MNEPGIRTAFKTDIGRRTENEDSYLALNAAELGGRADAMLVVADGMGGRASGQEASRLAVNSVHDAFLSGAAAEDLSSSLREGLRTANANVFREASGKTELQGMGTTCSAAAIKGGKAFFAHLGDSRIYLLRDGAIRRLTEDHSFVAEKVRTGELTEEQARQSRFRNVITRAVGLEADCQPAVGSVDLMQGDVLLLCSDGLSGPVPDNQIADILCGSSDPDEACDRLVKAALKNGGTDNVTVVLAVYGARTAVTRRVVKKEPKRISWVVPLLIGLLLGLGVGVLPGYLIFLKPPPKLVAVEKPPVVMTAYADPVPLTYEPLQPGFLALDTAGRLNVVDTQARRMVVDGNGKTLGTFPARDTFKPVKHTPIQMATADADGNLYVSDPAGKKILKFGKDGLFLCVIGEGKLTSPEALAVDKNGSVFVIDGGRLKVIRPKGSEQGNKAP